MTPRAPAREVPVESSALLAAVGEFMKTVGEFQPIDVQLEARRDRRRSRFQPCERGLRGRVVADEARPLQPQSGTHDEPHQKVEPGIAIEIGMAVDTMVARRFGQLVRGGAVHVNAGVTL